MGWCCANVCALDCALLLLGNLIFNQRDVSGCSWVVQSTEAAISTPPECITRWDQPADLQGTTPFVPSDQQTSSTRSHSLHAAVCVRSLHAAVCVHMCGISGTLPTLMLTSCSVALHCTAHTYTTHAHTMHAQSTTAAQQTCKSTKLKEPWPGTLHPCGIV